MLSFRGYQILYTFPHDSMENSGLSRCHLDTPSQNWRQNVNSKHISTRNLFCIKWDIFFLIDSFLIQFSGKEAFSYCRIFEYISDMKKICFTKNLGRVIWTLPLTIDVKTSIASTFLPVTFLHKMKYLFSNWFVFDSVFCKTNFDLLPNFRI